LLASTSLLQLAILRATRENLLTAQDLKQYKSNSYTGIHQAQAHQRQQIPDARQLQF
jgi:hypothetical protein